MKVVDTAIADVKELRMVRHGDDRGFFSEVFRSSVFTAHGIDARWVQDNHAKSGAAGTVRGLHLQAPPHAQAKLVRVSRGAIYDVAVDVRRGSPTYGRHSAVRLSAEDWNQVYVPEGFAHGYCTLEDDTEVLYKVNAEYAPQSEAGVLWNDPALGIEWPVGPGDAIVSAKDRVLPALADFETPFSFAPSAEPR